MSDETLVLTWLPCPYYCPIEPNHYSSFEDIGRRIAVHDGPVTIHVPPVVERVRGLHDNRWGYVSTCKGSVKITRRRRHGRC